MKFLSYYFLVFSIFILSCSEKQNSRPVPKGYTKFAELKNGKYDILIDTISFKENLIALFDSKDVTIDKIQIVKQQTLGDIKKDFYYILANDFKKKIKITRYLVYEKDVLFINDSISSEDVFEQTFLICIGQGNCNPHVFDVDGKRSWSCSDIYECSKDKFVDCKMFTTIVTED